jgi:hypothetical protein
LDIHQIGVGGQRGLTISGGCSGRKVFCRLVARLTKL